MSYRPVNSIWAIVLCALVRLCCGRSVAATLPAGFIKTDVDGYWNGAAGILFDEAGTLYQWDRDGRVWIFENDMRLPTPLIDISDEVGNWGDHGLLGFALHPNFRQNGYIYLLYVVDHHHLARYGTGQYNPETNEYHRATIGRVTRYTARSSDGFRSVDPASRTILVGESASTGFPILSFTQGVGTLLFSTDGTLLVSCGDSAEGSDYGDDPLSYYAQALEEGIIQPKENVGAFRAQMIDSLSGKILRLDPTTGNGIPSNPFYDPSNRRAPRSRVWALGLRNPFRMALRPESGSHNPGDARPGVIYVGDVGYYTAEELDVVTGPGMNFGWPIFEGFGLSASYEGVEVSNADAPNPLFGINGCTERYFKFNELLKEATLGAPSWPNPCHPVEQVPGEIPHFLHARPAIDWMHGTGPARTGIFNGNEAGAINIGAPGSPVSGPQFGGNCAIGGIWYDGQAFPNQYKGTYFVADLGGEWIHNMRFDSNNLPVSVSSFATDDIVVAMATHPIKGSLYYASVYSGIYKISYGGNAPPRAVATADVTYGPAPLTVSFRGDGSSDPEGLPLTYAWNFGDGSLVSAAVNPSHTFNAATGIPTRYNVALKVTDNAGATNVARLVVSVNNTPPSVTIVSPLPGTFYPLTGQSSYNLIANVTDKEHTTNQIGIVWRTDLHHNTHVHPGSADTNWFSTALVSPVGCNGDTYYYRVSAMVTDAAGLSASAFVDLHPACSSIPATISVLSLINNQLSLLVNGNPGPDYIVQASTDLNTWTEVFRTNSPPVPFTCTLPTVSEPPQRFFRVLLEP